MSESTDDQAFNQQQTFYVYIYYTARTGSIHRMHFTNQKNQKLTRTQRRGTNQEQRN